MQCRSLGVLALAGAVFLDSQAAAVAATCRAESAAPRKTLVELFTSDGCSSCPPANQWLSAALAMHDPNVIPVSLHVTYWNYLGWRDRFSAPFFDQRQDWYAHSATNRFPYTPELFRNGREWQDWRHGGSAGPAPSDAPQVTLGLESTVAANGDLDLQAVVHAAATGKLPPLPDTQLIVYAYQDGLTQHPDAGELRGATLTHDHVVLAWATVQAPQLDRSSPLRLTLPVDARAGATGVVGFLQNRSSGEVYQVLDLPACR